MAQNTIKLKFTIAPLSFYHSYDRMGFLEHSNRVILPKIVLNKLSIDSNLHFPLTIDINDTIVGVYEIYEDIDYIYVPDYICKKIGLVEPKQTNLKFLCYDLPKAEFIKLKPHQSAFYDIMDTKGFLENNLKKLYTHLEKGQTINKSMLTVKGPSGGLLPKYINIVEGRKATRDIIADYPITWKDI